MADEFWAQKLLEGIAPRLRVCSPASLDVRSTHDLIFGDSAGLADHGHSVKRRGSLAILIHFLTFPCPCHWRGINTVDWNNQWCKQKAIVVGQVNLIDTPALEQLSNELRILGVWLDKMVSYPKADGRFVWSFGSDVSIKIPSWELTYPHPRHVWVDDFPFHKVDRIYVRTLWMVRTASGYCKLQAARTLTYLWISSGATDRHRSFQIST